MPFITSKKDQRIYVYYIDNVFLHTV